MKPLLAAGLLLLPAQTGIPPTAPQDKVIDVRAARASTGNTFEALWSAYKKAAAKNDLESARNVLREIRRLRIERNIFALDSFALAHVAQGLDLLRKGDKERAESEFAGASALDPYLPDAYLGMSLVELQKIPLGIVPAVRDIVTGVAAPLHSARGRQRAFMLGVAALLLTLFATTTIAALALLLRHGTLLLHDLEESFGGGRAPAVPIAIFAALLLLPVLTLQGYGWLPFWWLTLVFVYLSRLEKALVAVLMLLGLAVGPLVNALQDTATAQQNPLFRASMASLETGPDARALLDLEDGVRKHTDDRDLVYLLAIQYKKAGRYEDAAALYRDILRTEPNDSIALNNLANIEFAGGEFPAAIARYKQGIESGPPQEVAATFYYNLSLAHLQRFEYQPAQEARSHADRAASSLVKEYDRLWKYDKGDYAVVDLSLDEDQLAEKFAGVEEGVGKKNLAGKPPSARGVERWLPAMRNRFSAMVGVFLVLAVVIARVRGKKMFTMHCLKCGTPFCRHCHLGAAAEGLCTQCHHLFMVRDGVSGPARNQKLLEVQKEDERRGRIFRLLSLVSPGAGHVYAQRVLVGFLFVFLWYGVLSLTLLGGRVLPFTEVSGTVAKPWDLTVAAVVLLAVFIAANRMRPGFDSLMPARRAPATARRGRVRGADMALEGTIKDFGLPDIFQLIGLQRKTGLLTLKHEKENVTVTFESGQVVMADSLAKRLEDRLGNVLVKQGKLSKEKLDEALQTQKATLQRLGHILTTGNYITPKDLKDALQVQVSQIVFRVFRWRDGEYHFAPTDSVDFDRDNFTPMSADFILMEGIRMVDEWPIIEKKIPSMDIVFRTVVDPSLIEVASGSGGGLEEVVAGMAEPKRSAASSASKIRLTAEEERIYRKVDGTRTVQGVIDSTGGGEFEVCRILFDLLNRNIITPVGRGPARDASMIGLPAAPPSAAPGYLVAGLCVLLALGGIFIRREAPFAVTGLPPLLRGAHDLMLDAASHARLERLDRAILAYHLVHGNPPGTLHVLVGEGLVDRSYLHDPWARPYHYALTESGYLLSGVDDSGKTAPRTIVERSLPVEKR